MPLGVILMKRILLGILALTLPVGSAAAADLIIDEPALEAAVGGWEGAYLGVQTSLVGGTFDDDFPPAPLASVGTNDLGGGSLGIYGGWNAQFDNLVLGVDAGFAYALVSGSGENAGDEVMNANLDWTAAVRGRAGVVADDALLYVAGGLAAAQANVTISSLPGGAEDLLVGWTLGAGAELAFDDHWVGRAEYSYTDYGALGYTITPPGDEGEVSFATHTVSLGIAYRF
jgi:outer membrane immunogenic protein